MTLLTTVLGENREVLHCELEFQRSARQLTLSNFGVGRKNLEDLHCPNPDDHAELECQRSARQVAGGAGKETERLALPPTVPPSAKDADHGCCCCCGCCGCCGWLLLWWLWWLWCGRDVMTMSLSVPPHERAPNWGDRTPGSQTPSVPATLGLTPRWTEAEKYCKTAANHTSSPPPCRPNKARHAQLHCAYPSLLRNGSVLTRRDELNLRHFHCAREPN